MPAPNLGLLSQPMPGANAPGTAPGAEAPPPAAGQPAPEGGTALANAQVSVALSILNQTIGKLDPGSRQHTVLMRTVKELAREFSGSPKAQAAGAAVAQPEPQPAAAPAPPPSLPEAA